MDARTLKRIHRVRTLQLTLTRADEMRARDRTDAEAELGRRIATLADAVSPRAQTLTGVGLGAEAHFRTRLHASAEAAAQRLATAERLAARAADATRVARQDQSAVEKLLDRTRAADLVREMRALEDMPAGSRKRHGPC